MPRLALTMAGVLTATSLLAPAAAAEWPCPPLPSAVCDIELELRVLVTVQATSSGAHIWGCPPLPSAICDLNVQVAPAAALHGSGA